MIDVVIGAVIGAGPGARRARRSALAGVLALGLGSSACTEPNPYLPAAGSSSGPGTSEGAAPATDTSAASSSSDGATATASSSSDGEPGCVEQGMTCVAAAPAGFGGPFAWLERPENAPMDCMGAFSQPLVEAFSELSAPAAACDCSCGPLNNAECGPATLDLHSGGVCAGAVQDSVELTGVCNVISVAGWSATASVFFDAPAVVGGGCLPLPSVELQPAAFLTRHLACGGALEPADCPSGRLCAPPPDDPFHARMCVWQAGDVPCPADGDYVARTLLHRDIDDGRGCEQCTCAVPTGPCEGTSAIVSTALDCSVITAVVPVDDCLGGIGGPSLRSVYYTEGSPPGACEPAVIVPIGDAAGIDPVTFCCTR